MSLVKKILLIKYKPNPENTGVLAVPQYIDNISSVRALDVDGCPDWVVYNLGTAKLYIFDYIEVLPGTWFTLPKSTPLPLLEDIPFRFENDYAITRNISHADTGLGEIEIISPE